MGSLDQSLASLDGDDSIKVDEADITTALTANGLTVSQDGANPTYPLTYEDIGETKPQIGVTAQTVAGDNTAHDLIRGTGNRTNGLLIVAGCESGGSTKHFVDIVIYAGVIVKQVIDSETRGTVGARSYSNEAEQPTIAIDESGQNYDVTCWLIGSDRF